MSLGKNAATGHAEISLYASRRGLLQKYDLDQDREVGKLSVSYNHDQAPFSASPTKGGKTKPRAGSKLRPANKKAGSHGATGTLISYCANESHLCTVEQSTAGMNIWIKFWIRDSETAKYEVETTLLNPHDKRVTCVVGHKSKPVVVTSSVDGKLKIWSRSPESGEWVCACQTSAPCTYLTAACFNASGDVLAGESTNHLSLLPLPPPSSSLPLPLSLPLSLSLSCLLLTSSLLRRQLALGTTLDSGAQATWSS